MRATRPLHALFWVKTKGSGHWTLDNFLYFTKKCVKNAPFTAFIRQMNTDMA